MLRFLLLLIPVMLVCYFVIRRLLFRHKYMMVERRSEIYGAASDLEARNEFRITAREAQRPYPKDPEDKGPPAMA
jgi:hypothetical protein